MRWMKRTGAVLLLVLALAMITVAVYIWRSLPQLSGSLQATGLQQSVQIKRDASDVTHILRNPTPTPRSRSATPMRRSAAGSLRRIAA